MVVWESTSCASQRDKPVDKKGKRPNQRQRNRNKRKPPKTPAEKRDDNDEIEREAARVESENEKEKEKEKEKEPEPNSEAGGGATLDGLHISLTSACCTFPHDHSRPCTKSNKKSDRARCWFGRIQNRYLSPKRYRHTFSKERIRGCRCMCLICGILQRYSKA
jgi:hypothetical protein